MWNETEKERKKVKLEMNQPSCQGKTANLVSSVCIRRPYSVNNFWPLPGLNTRSMNHRQLINNHLRNSLHSKAGSW